MKNRKYRSANVYNHRRASKRRAHLLFLFSSRVFRRPFSFTRAFNAGDPNLQ